MWRCYYARILSRLIRATSAVFVDHPRLAVCVLHARFAHPRDSGLVDGVARANEPCHGRASDGGVSYRDHPKARRERTYPSQPQRQSIRLSRTARTLAKPRLQAIDELGCKLFRFRADGEQVTPPKPSLLTRLKIADFNHLMKG